MGYAKQTFKIVERNNKPVVKIKKLNADAVIPAYAKLNLKGLLNKYGKKSS